MHVESFDSMDELFADMARRTDQANKNLAPEQKGLDWGSHWIQFMVSDGGRDGAPLIIVGRCHTTSEVYAAERAAMGPFTEDNASECAAELVDTISTIIGSHENGYLFGTAYSTVEPDGELGSTHRSSVWPLSSRAFEALHSNGWRLGGLPPTVVDELKLAWGRYALHLAKLATGVKR